MELYGCLYEAHKKIVSIMQTGQRYLGTYYRVALYGGVILCCCASFSTSFLYSYLVMITKSSLYIESPS